MTDRFTPEEWEIVAGLPLQATTAAAVSDGVAVFGTLRELDEGPEAIVEGGAAYPDNALIARILADRAADAAAAEAELRRADEGELTAEEQAANAQPDEPVDPTLDTQPTFADDLAQTAAPGDAVLAIEAPDVDPRDPLAFVHEVVANAMQAREILAAKATPDEASQYAAWVLGAVDRVINRSKSGGFLGIGGERVTEDEARFRAELAGALGVSGESATA